MDRVVATPPESVEELCLVRLGLVVRRARAFPFAARMGRAATARTQPAWPVGTRRPALPRRPMAATRMARSLA